MTKNMLIALLWMILSACGGIDDTSNEDYRIIYTQIDTLPDGDSLLTRTVGEIDTNWDTQDTDISGPWQDESDGEVEKFAYGANSRYGLYSTSTGVAGDDRCPNSWSSPQYCLVPGTKSFKFLYYPAIGAGDGIVDADLYTEWVQAQADLSVGGFSHCTGLLCPGAPASFNAWFDASDGTCQSGSVACQVQAEGALFTSGGKRFRKTVAHNAFGWNAGFLVMTAVNLEPAVINALNQAGTTNTTFRANSVQNTLEHELAHVDGLHHNASGSTTRDGLPIPERFYSPGTVLLASEVSAASSYAP